MNWIALLILELEVLAGGDVDFENEEHSECLYGKEDCIGDEWLNGRSWWVYLCE